MTKIAIVEDNKTIRESLTEFVQADRDCSCVCVCATAEEALRVIPKYRPEIVLMDIQLPNLSGIECTAQLKQLLPSVHIIMVTVYEDTERIFKALRAGACGYLLKRCAPEELLFAIDEKSHEADLTEKGRNARDTYCRLLAAIETDWETRFGGDKIHNVRSSLEQLNGGLLRSFDHHPDGWRASLAAAIRRPPGQLHRRQLAARRRSAA